MGNKIFAKALAQIAKMISQIPTTSKIKPPPRLTMCVLLFKVVSRFTCARPIARTNTAMIKAMVSAAIKKALKAAVLLATVRACKARPARIGPVQPNPAKIYTKPYKP